MAQVGFSISSTQKHLCQEKPRSGTHHGLGLASVVVWPSLLQLRGLQPAVALIPSTVACRPAGRVVPIFLSYSATHQICSQPAPRNGRRRSPLAGADHPARTKGHTRRRSGDRKRAENGGLRAKITENKNMRFCQVRFFGRRVARPSLQACFAARLGRVALSNLLLESRGESGHSRGNQP